MLDPRQAKDTIAAVATPPGEGGVGIVRISGPQSRALARALFRPRSPSFADFIPHHLHYGHLIDRQGRVLDDVLAAFMPGPRSFTGEDVAELHCHGGRAVLSAVLDELLAGGARLAERGEFTYRAFLNGRMDLTQAEAVAELIHAPTKAAVHLAQVKRSGLLGERIRALRARLEALRAKLVIAVDFPEDEVECLSPDELIGTCGSVRADIETLLAGVDRARAWREGPLAVLAGRVNAGKSSLMNALLGRDRAIVTDQPGTTRDYLEESLNLDGLTVRLADTAGIRATDDLIEAAGLRMGRELMDRADLVLLLADGCAPPDADTLDAASGLAPEKGLVLLTKADRDDFAPENGGPLAALGFEVLAVSSRSGAGLDRFCARMRERLLGGSGQPDPDELAPNARQASALADAAEELGLLALDAGAGVPYDLLGVRLETATTALSGITGDIAPEDVLHSIFDNFCIGK
ncbi:tRNA uridine-5-carboxymethylaminomethyl(34) synthesis GTPase MnmE [Pseudodesulfovibrio sp.]|uniref:tRNA uridine-5-carboxymethylaminomethyl(34) synthesis GTPase MnmE n=1 Tax=Pseudodesulfovibrio sp. TaxID=2035812 RepID=UPI0026123104|nr:tRNA uridine-5-carboxymethylaminomethyl(34) synthesis GTPase MnmE [Pseudodesulfovibrio sp.]MDD3311009.1 tRNA uridine-5-carboxymethylaminomethyl(34) synthesis GTPase MnmE [Pseudodesulfovibrio sp.]